MIRIETLHLASSLFHHPDLLKATVIRNATRVPSTDETSECYKKGKLKWHPFISIYFSETLQGLCLDLSLIQWIIQTVCTVHCSHQVNLHHYVWTALITTLQLIHCSLNNLSSAFQEHFNTRDHFGKSKSSSVQPAKKPASVSFCVPCRVSHHSKPVGWFSVCVRRELQQGGITSEWGKAKVIQWNNLLW